MIEHTFDGDWRHAVVPILLTVLVLGAGLAFALS